MNISLTPLILLLASFNPLQAEQPNKAALITALTELHENIVAEDYSKAAGFLLIPAEIKAKDYPDIFNGFIQRDELSLEGIQRLAKEATFGTALETFGESRAKSLAERASVSVENVYGFYFETPEATAEVLAVWTDGQFRLMRIDDIGKLEPLSNSGSEESSSAPESISDLAAAAEKNPKSHELRAQLALALYGQDELVKAWQQLRIASQLTTENQDYVDGLATMIGDFENTGLFEVGNKPEQVLKFLGSPDEKVDMGAGQSRWLYSFFGVDFQDGKVFCVIDLRGATEELFHPTEIVAVNLDGRQWSTGFRKKEDGLVTESWFLPSESSTNWNEQFTIERILDVSSEGSTEELANYMIEQMKAGTAGVQAKILVSDDKSATVSLEIPIGENGGAIHRLVRIFKGPKDLHRVGISMVKRPDEETQKKWFGIFQAAKLQSAVSE